MEQKLLTYKRQQELIRVNQVLAVLVVVLAFTGGYLLSEREEWLKKSAEPVITETPMPAARSSLSVKKLTDSPLSALLSGARYEWTIGSSPISEKTLTQLVWAAQGRITSWGERTVPSYKSAFPLTLTVYVRYVEGMNRGFYRFNAEQQILESSPYTAAMSLPETQPALAEAAAIIAIAAPIPLKDDPLTWNEAGGVAQNILLSAREASLVTYLTPASSLPETVTRQFTPANTTLFWLMPIGINKESEIPAVKK